MITRGTGNSYVQPNNKAREEPNESRQIRRRLAPAQQRHGPNVTLHPYELALDESDPFDTHDLSNTAIQ